MTRKKQRMVFLGSGLACFAVAAALMLVALQERVTFFYAPSELAESSGIEGTGIRLGGLVVEGSVEKLEDGLTTRFEITDGRADVTVIHVGILPDLFREGQGVVASGVLSDGIFRTSEVLAKHDETYMPPEVAEALKKTGYWRENE